MAKTTNPITYNNKIYNTLKELAKDYNINYDTLKDRLTKRKWSLEKAIETPVKSVHDGNKLKYKNKTYKSIRKLAKEYNVKYNTLTQRLQNGWSVKKAIETPITYNKRSIKYNNKTYKSIAELARDYNIPPKKLQKKLDRGWTLKKAIETPVQIKDYSIAYDNKTYPSITELAKKYNIPDKTLYSRINERKWSVKKAIETPIRPHSPKGFKIIKSAYTHNNIDYYECIHDSQKYILSIQEMKDFTEKDHDTC